MKQLLRLTMIPLLFVPGCATTAPDRSVAQAGRPPNVIVVLTDDQGYGDLSCYGHPTIHTPHIDRLASEGMKLTQFYVASPVCSPSRAALLTGCYPKRVSMHRHVVFPGDDHGLHPDEVTIADLLSGHGYATGCFGKWHLGHRDGLLPTDQGFDTFFGIPYSNDMSRFHRRPDDEYPHALPLLRDKTIVEWEPDQRLLTRRCTEEAIEFVEENADRPFLVYLPHAMPHIPLYASEEFEGRSPRGLYGDVIEEIDWSVGALRSALERRGIAGDTVIIVTSDNGPWLRYEARGGSAGPLAGGKGSNREGGQRVPCVVWSPGRIPPGSVCRELTTSMDLLPTIAAMTGTRPPGDRTLDGHDITPLLTVSVNATSPTEAFLYYTSHGELAGIRSGRWKLLLDSGSLHDVEVDVSEQWDLADRHPLVVERLREQAIAIDAGIARESRPEGRVEEPLWSPDHLPSEVESMDSVGAR